MTVSQIVLSILITFSFVQFIQAEDGCKFHLYLDCTHNKALTGHVIDANNIIADPNSVEICSSKCFYKDQCVSYNVGPVQGGIRMCELNAADHWMRPDALVSKQGFLYCPIANPCSSSPCPENRLCTPDFDWDTYSCDDGAWTQWDPWSSCFHPKCPQIRKRTCTNPAPQNSGKNCAGADQESRKCSNESLIEESKVQREGCNSSLGMESKAIKDEQITASSFSNDFTLPHFGRLNNQQSTSVPFSIGSWIPKKKAIDEWLEVDLLQETIITKVATQGRPATYDVNHWVTKYTLVFSNDKKAWCEADGGKTYIGNSDRHTIVTHTLENPFKARYIRLIVKAFNDWPSIRMELYGCTP